MHRPAVSHTSSSASAPTRSSRRRLLKQGAHLAAGSVLAAVASRGWTAEDNTIRLALVGCGGRGSGAAGDALSSTTGPTRLIAMADVFEDRLAGSHKALTEQFGPKIDVPAERRFVGFDAYKKAIDILGPGGVLIQATHAVFRPTHVAYAIEKGVHVFMEKSFAPDPGGTQDLLALSKTADAKGLKIGCGVMCRHSESRQALIDRIREGAIGDVHLIRAYRMDGGARMGPFPGGQSELLWQIRRPYFFIWASSGWFSEMMIHQVDECCWIKDAWPVSAHGLGGCEPGASDAGENLHTYSIEYTFADGAKAIVNSRAVPNSFDEFATFVHGTKSAAQFSGNVHAPTVHIYADQRTNKDAIAWRPPRERISPYQKEWDVLLTAVRNGTPHNELPRACNSNLTTIMGRAAVHLQRNVTWDEVAASTFKFTDAVKDFTPDTPPPSRADANGFYPKPNTRDWREI